MGSESATAVVFVVKKTGHPTIPLGNPPVPFHMSVERNGGAVQGSRSVRGGTFSTTPRRAFRRLIWSKDATTQHRQYRYGSNPSTPATATVPTCRRLKTVHTKEKLRQVPKEYKRDANRTYDTCRPKPTSIVTLCICMPTNGRAAGLARLALPPQGVAGTADRTAGMPWMTNPAPQRRSHRQASAKLDYTRYSMRYSPIVSILILII